MAKQEFHITIPPGSRSAVELIREASGLSMAEIKKTMHKGAVWLEDHQGIRRLRRVMNKPVASSVIHVYLDSGVLEQTINAPQLIDDLGGYSVWFKPAGVLSQGSKWGDHCTINRWIEKHDPKNRQAFITHRLDRAACGLMIIAHGKSLASQISQLFEQRNIEKIYRCRVHGLVDLETPYTIEQPIDEKSASTTILNVLQNHRHNSSLLTIRIDSGRKHQIRRHLGEMGYPVIGDRLHGIDQHGELKLCAWSLAFECPLEQVPRFYELPARLLPEGLS